MTPKLAIYASSLMCSALFAAESADSARYDQIHNSAFSSGPRPHSQIATASVSTGDRQNMNDQSDDKSPDTWNRLSQKADESRESMSETGDRVKDRASDAKESLSQKAGEMRDKASQKMTDAKKTVSEKASRASDKISQKAHDVKEKVKGMAGKSSDSQEREKSDERAGTKKKSFWDFFKRKSQD